jgi:17beta-estradiol 17-dehydrogenase / very-long-chain 3-oxoacyl-CoA reductase
MVTGATDGIGKAICEELARTGFNIILVSRTLSKLQNVAKELEKINSKIKTHVVAYDFGERVTLEDYTSVFSPLVDKFDISLLVNNVGTEQHNTFDRVNIKHVFASININVLPQTILTKIFMTKMNNRKSRSGMINLSSFAGEMPFAMKSVYSATKIYNHYLTVGLKEETALDSNIDWLSVKPLEVETVLSTTKADGIVIITPKQCADCILNDLGYEDETYTHWSHKVQDFLMLNLIPNWLLYSVVRRYWFKFFIKRDEKSE